MYYLLIFEEFFLLGFFTYSNIAKSKWSLSQGKSYKRILKKKQKETLFLNIWQITVDLNMLGRVGS